MMILPSLLLRISNIHVLPVSWRMELLRPHPRSIPPLPHEHSTVWLLHLNGYIFSHVLDLLLRGSVEGYQRVVTILNHLLRVSLQVDTDQSFLDPQRLPVLLFLSELAVILKIHNLCKFQNYKDCKISQPL